jgi:hypothetical protein
MKTFYIKITDLEGGKDAKLLVLDMANIYQKAALINNFQCSAEH